MNGVLGCVVEPGDHLDQHLIPLMTTMASACVAMHLTLIVFIHLPLSLSSSWCPLSSLLLFRAFSLYHGQKPPLYCIDMYRLFSVGFVLRLGLIRCRRASSPLHPSIYPSRFGQVLFALLRSSTWSSLTGDKSSGSIQQLLHLSNYLTRREAIQSMTSFDHPVPPSLFSLLSS